MNKAHIMMAAFSLVLSTVVVLPALNIAIAQYSSQGQTGGVTLEEQLKLAREKIANAKQQGAYGSGTAMFGTNIDSTVIMIIVIGVIIGGVAAAFFAASATGKKKPVEASYGGSGSESSGSFCTNCGAPAGNTKFCGNCGAKL